MTQSFNGVTLDGTGSIVNFGNTRPTDILDTPTMAINSNSRTGAILRLDGDNSVQFSGVYQILSGGQSEYELIKAQQGNIGVLINDTQTIQNVALINVGLAQSLGNGVLRCSLQFEYMG